MLVNALDPLFLTLLDSSPPFTCDNCFDGRFTKFMGKGTSAETIIPALNITAAIILRIVLGPEQLVSGKLVSNCQRIGSVLAISLFLFSEEVIATLLAFYSPDALPLHLCR